MKSPQRRMRLRRLRSSGFNKVSQLLLPKSWFHVSWFIVVVDVGGVVVDDVSVSVAMSKGVFLCAIPMLKVLSVCVFVEWIYIVRG